MHELHGHSIVADGNDGPGCAETVIGGGRNKKEGEERTVATEPGSIAQVQCGPARRSTEFTEKKNEGASRQGRGKRKKTRGSWNSTEEVGEEFEWRLRREAAYKSSLLRDLRGPP